MFYFYDFILKSKCETKIALYFLFNKFSEYTKLHAANRRFQGGQIFVARRIHKQSVAVFYFLKCKSENNIRHKVDLQHSLVDSSMLTYYKVP